MRIAFLTTDDPLYLPAFFERVLGERAADTAAIYAVAPLYKNQTTRAAAWRYFRTFGLGDTIALSRKTIAAKSRGSTIEQVSRAHGVHYAEPADVNAAAFLDELRQRGTDLIVSVSCPQIFKRPLIDLPEKGCLNIHGAILPEYRGIMPSFWMLANSETRAGVSIYFVNEQIDAGDLCGQRTFDIEPDDTLDSFLRRSKALAAELLLDVLRDIERGSVEATPLDLSEGSYFSWPDRDAVARFRAAGRRLW